MPSLVMRAPAGSLLEQTSRLVVAPADRLRRRARRAVGHLGVRLQRRATSSSPTSTRTSACPGLGLKRGLSENAVVAPYATALAAMVDPARGGAQLRAGSPPSARAAATASTRRSTTRRTRLPEGADVAIVRAYMAHHQGMTVVAIANALLRRRDAGALPCRADRAGDRAAAAGAHAARRRGGASAGGGSRDGGDGPRPASCRRCAGSAPRTPPRRRCTCSPTAATR